MRRLLTRTIGIALILAGLAGLVFAMAGLVVLIRVEERVVLTAHEQVDLVDQALSATGDGLDIAGESLAQAVSTVRTLETTVTEVADTVGSSVPALESISTLVGVQLPATIATTQETLESVADSAEAMDDFLAVMSATPFLRTSEYSPDAPLGQGFRDVAASLDGIPASLLLTREQLIATSRNLSGLKDSLGTMARDVGQIAISIGQAEAVLDQYEDVIGQLQSSVRWIRDSLPTWVKWLRVGLSLLLVWLGIAQFALITQGWELIGRSRRRLVVQQPAIDAASEPAARP